MVTRFHALRHYSATELLTGGVDLKTVSGRLGHQSRATTLRFYLAWQEATDGAAADTVPRPEIPPRWPHEIIAHGLRKAIADGTYPDWVASADERRRELTLDCQPTEPPKGTGEPTNLGSPVRDVLRHHSVPIRAARALEADVAVRDSELVSRRGARR